MSATFDIKVDLANEAFSDPRELGRILRRVADRVDNGEDAGRCMDINDNAVGEWAIRTGKAS